MLAHIIINTFANQSIYIASANTVQNSSVDFVFMFYIQL